MKTSKKIRNTAMGLAFLAPNILGFLAFTVVPLVFSLVLAFSNWDIRLHNMFKIESIRFIWFDNFPRLFHERDFFRFFGNTLFFMMGIPLSIAGSLGGALLLIRDTRGGSRRVFAWLLATAVLAACLLMVAALGGQASAFAILLCGMAGVALVAGVAGGSLVYRTMFFVPHFASGVAVYILWKKLYSPAGPVNNFLNGPLLRRGEAVNQTPAVAVQAAAWVCLALLALTAAAAIRRMGALWRDGELGLRPPPCRWRSFCSRRRWRSAGSPTPGSRRSAAPRSWRSCCSKSRGRAATGRISRVRAARGLATP
jgi:multiple sugar transport system permease protein